MSLNPKAPVEAAFIIAGLLAVASASAQALDGPPAPIVPAAASASGTASGASTSAANPSAAPDDLSLLNEIIVTATEPRYVAPTRRDRIGRIWAPVYINGQGPFRLVLDSGASSSGITARVAQQLGLTLDLKHKVLLRGVVGAAPVPIVRVQSFDVGDLSFGKMRLPIINDALGGADGILGTDRMDGRRILIDFHHDLITIGRSHNEPAPLGYVTIPFKLISDELLVTSAWIGAVRTTAIIDTGGQATIANLALRQALQTPPQPLANNPEQIEDVTQSVQTAQSAPAPPILLGTSFAGSTIKISNDRLTFGDMHIFEHWHMTKDPAMLIGMDTLGRLDILIIDYRRHELQMRLNEEPDGG